VSCCLSRRRSLFAEAGAGAARDAGKIEEKVNKSKVSVLVPGRVEVEGGQGGGGGAPMLWVGKGGGAMGWGPGGGGGCLGLVFFWG